MTLARCTVLLTILVGLSACGGDDLVDQSCDDVQRYQQVVPRAPIKAPEGLDPLNEFAKMPIPKAEEAPSRPPGSRCIDLPPSIGVSR